MLRVFAFQIADSIDIKGFKTVFTAEIDHEDSDELFYRIEIEKFVYVFKYGIVCFLGYNEVEMTAFIQVVLRYCKNIFDQRLSEEFDIETNAPRNNFGFNKIEIQYADTEILRLIMLNVSQSVALDHFSQQTNMLLEETNYHTQILEKKADLIFREKN
jgi:uncharacterized Rmd1/YagE family protein